MNISQFKRTADRKARNIVHRWMKLERKQHYRTASDGKDARLSMFRRCLGF